MDTEHGDYERIYDQVFQAYHPLYLATFEDTEHVEVRKRTIEMQFCRFITDFDALLELQREIDDFMKCLDSKPIKIFAFQLACTCHWVSLMAVVVKRQVFFYYFDSKNINCYGMNEDQIWNLIRDINEERKKTKKTSWTDFKMQCQVQCLKDINILLKLLPDMFMKKNTMYDHILNTNFKEQYTTHWKPNIIDPLELLRVRPEKHLVHDHLCDTLGDLKTFVYYLAHLTNGHTYLSLESKEYFIEVYIEICHLLDRCLPSITRYRKGREVIDAWEAAKDKLGKYFQPNY